MYVKLNFVYQSGITNLYLRKIFIKKFLTTFKKNKITIKKKQFKNKSTK